MQCFSGQDYLKIDIASNFGLDKKTWAERLAWFDEHQNTLHEVLPQAENPALYFAGVNAWEAVQRGEAVGYPISLDATASGTQLMSVLTGDRSAAQICNVVNTGRREDAYKSVYEHMLGKIGESAKIDRSDVKRSVMTSFYGSKAIPEEVFGKGKLLNTFLESMEELAPACWELNQFFLDMWDPNATSYDWVLPDNFHVHIKVETQVTETVHFLNEPFEITRKVNGPKEKGRSLSANTVHSLDGMIVREMTRRCSYDPNWIQLVRDILDGEVDSHFATSQESKEAHRMVGILWGHYQASGYLSAHILDYIDSETLKMVDQDVIQELVDSLPMKPFQVLSVHDCFRVLPSYGNDLRKQYVRQLFEISRSNMLSFLLSQLLGRDVKIGKLDPTLANDILNSDYALS